MFFPGICLSKGGGEGFSGPANQSSYQGHSCSAALIRVQETPLLSLGPERLQRTATSESMACPNMSSCGSVTIYIHVHVVPVNSELVINHS